MANNNNVLCSFCGKPVKPNLNNPFQPTRFQKNKFCSHDCYKAYYKAFTNSSFRGKTSATTGAISELRVSIDLLSKGYHVFRALSPSCPCDLAIIINNHVLRIEVRTAMVSPHGTLYRTINKRDDPNNIDVYAWVTANEIIYEPPIEQSPVNITSSVASSKEETDGK